MHPNLHLHPKEIWIDAQVSGDATDLTLKFREEMVKLAESHFKIFMPDSISKATLDPNEKSY